MGLAPPPAPPLHPSQRAIPAPCLPAVSPADIRLVECVGEGSFGEVWLAEYCGALVAVKILAKVGRCVLACLHGSWSGLGVGLALRRGLPGTPPRGVLASCVCPVCGAAPQPTGPCLLTPRHPSSRLDSRTGQERLHDTQHAAAAGAAQPEEGGAAHEQAAPPKWCVLCLLRLLRCACCEPGAPWPP